MASRPLKYLTLVVTGQCNLACRYCYRGKATQDVMRFEHARMAIDLGALKGVPFHIQISGGEPLLAWDVVLEILQYVRSRGLNVTIGLQTNGTLITGAIARVFLDYGVQVGVSLDGPVIVHNQLRGKGEQTIKGMATLSRYGVPFRTTTVVTANNVRSLGKTALLLAALPTAEGMALDLLVCKGGQSCPQVCQANPRNLISGIHGLWNALEFVNARRHNPIVLREAERLLGRNNGQKNPAYCHAQLGQSMAVCPKGGVYPCGQAVGDPRFFRGFVMECAQPPLCTSFIKHFILRECRNCAAKEVCPGDCPSRLYYNGEGARPLSCVMNQTLFKLLNTASAMKQSG